MFDVSHPQTILAYGMNGKDLPAGNGAPVRLRVERHCGYKQLKFIKSIEVVSPVEHHGREDRGHKLRFWFSLVCRCLDCGNYSRAGPGISLVTLV